ncbi:MAG: 30S ribosomal protein S3 [Chlamydiia bacterium]|nr:30S ribosomal protein S3 [Chlamydiia bacterium]
MGQKTHPTGFRLVVNKKWRSTWYSAKRNFRTLLLEDYQIRKFLAKRLKTSSCAEFYIERMADAVQVTIYTARPGLVIGKKGAGIDVLKKELAKLTNREVRVDVVEVKRPDLNAKLVADNITQQLERRVGFRRAQKRSCQTCMEAGAKGVKIMLSGRLGGAEIARSETAKEGRVPLHTLKADIDYATSEAHTTYGIIGVKVWINHGEQGA